ncbi:Caspase domain-containing protein [Variovorax sp. CF079]|uniref:caspase family protein n=1 Tax=Variovorax sp. CF079 TaxID=1882774 RepID=UPI000880C477|nr:caspase family protein [Variovorax sp. CF079]SDC44643.1 Caspase domain-containing protein [Variovorax sp. CF079]
MAKLALCIGINNYPGTDMDLAGCVNDANDWATELASRGFEVTKLIDAQATKAGMVDGFRKVIGAAVRSDVVVITFSGHGTYQYDIDGDEEDDLDEALCPHDIRAIDAALIDDEIHALFKARKDGVHIVLISDSCHSGTVSRAIPRSGDVEAGRAPRFMPMENWMSPEHFAKGGPRGATAPHGSAHVASTPFTDAPQDDAGDVLMAGCEEGEDHFSYDATFMDRPNGAFTFYALKALRTLRSGATYADWHRALKDSLPSTRYPQTPRIQGTETSTGRAIFT